jgi:hypothetical protein
MDISDPRRPSSSMSTTGDKNGVPMKYMGPDPDMEANSLGSSGISAQPSDDAQAGVKNIEAVSMTWKKWGLIAAYVRFVRI